MLLRKVKPFDAMLETLGAVRKRTARWWLSMSDQEQREIARRGMTLGLCAAGVSFAMPAMSVAYDQKRIEAEFRDQAARLAEARQDADVVSAVRGASALFDHNWVLKVGYSIEREPRAALSRYAMRDRDGAAVASVASFEPRHLKVAEAVAAEHKCLAEAVYYEARSESKSGQLAVAEVVANRVRDHRYPNSICGVVYQGSERTTGCQFTFTCDGSTRRKPAGRLWREAQGVAAQVLMEIHEPRTGAATHYHATYVDPIWNSGLVRTNRIGTHIFYRFPRGGEWAEVRNAVAARRAREATQRAPTITPASSEDLNQQQLSVLSPAP